VTVGASIVVHLIVFLVFRQWLSALLFGKTYRALDAYNKLRWNERTVAFLHALVSAQGAFRGFYAMLPTPLNLDTLTGLACTRAAAAGGDKGDPTRLAEFYLCVTLGYFAYDTVIYGTIARHHTFVDWLHHVLSEVQYAVHLSMRWAYLIPIGLQTNEISTPFLHLSWFLSTALGPSRAKSLQAAVQVLFALFFLLSRVLFDLALVGLALMVLRRSACPSDVPMPAKLFSLASFIAYVGVQLLWFAKIVAKLYQLYAHGEDTHKPKPKKK
jgi:hypothetical protein